MVAAFISRTPGDPEELRALYEENYTALAGAPGRGEDWGTPLVVLQHICGFSDDAMYIIDVFENEETLNNLVNAPEKLPDHLRPSVGRTDAMWKNMGGVNLRDRPKDIIRLKVAKYLPPLTGVVTEQGGLRRPRSA